MDFRVEDTFTDTSCMSTARLRWIVSLQVALCRGRSFWKI